MTIADLIAAFGPGAILTTLGPIGTIAALMIYYKNQTKGEKAHDPMKVIEAKLDHIVSNQTDIKTDLAVLLDRRGK